MFRFLQISALFVVVTLVVANESEAKPKAPVHGPGSSHDPKGPTKLPVHGPGSSHDPRGPNPTTTHPRDYRSWGHREWNSFYRCEYCWSPVYRSYFYFYAPAGCYYPVTYIEQFPPVPTEAAPIAPISPVAPVPLRPVARPMPPPE